jgi:hypothetical protein
MSVSRRTGDGAAVRRLPPSDALTALIFAAVCHRRSCTGGIQPNRHDRLDSQTARSRPLSDRREVPDGIGDLQFEQFESVQPTSSRRIRAERSSFAEAVKTRAMVEPTRGRLEMPPQMADLEPPRRPQMAIAERAHPAPADARFRGRRAHGRLNRHYVARALQPWNPHT